MILRRLHYNEVYLGEKQYGIQDNLLRLKRVGKVSIGNFRKKTAKKLMDSAMADSKKHSKACSILKNPKYSDAPYMTLSNNKNITKELVKESRNNGGRVFYVPGGGGGSFMPKTEKLANVATKVKSDTILGKNLDKYSNLDRAISNHLVKPTSTSIITVDKGNIGTLAHEVGHQSRYVTKNPISLRSMKTVESTNRLMSRNPKNLDSKKVGLLNTAVDNTFRLVEERGASRKGLELLKKHGATEEQLLRSKRLLGVAGDTYKYANRATMKGLLSDFIQIPSRKVSNLKKSSNNLSKKI